MIKNRKIETINEETTSNRNEIESKIPKNNLFITYIHIRTELKKIS